VFLGGVITEWTSWRFVFLVNIPVALLVLGIAKTYLLPGFKNRGKVDLFSAALITSALIILVYAIVSSDQRGFNSIQSIVLLALSVIAFIIFIIKQKSSRDPLLPLSIFKRPDLSAANIIMALLAASWIPLWFFLNLYLQQILNYSAFRSGLALLPMTIAIMMIMVGFTGKLVQKFGFKANLVAGLIFLTISLLVFSTVSVNGSFLSHVLVPSLLGAIGMSLAYIPGTMAAMSGATASETGLASGIVNTSYQVGSAIGLAILVVIVSYVTKSSLSEGLSQVESLNSGFRSGFLYASIVSGLAALLSIIFIRK
jgi:MFS family permease